MQRSPAYVWMFLNPVINSGVQHTFNYQAGLVGARQVSLQHLHQTTNQHNLGGGNSNIFDFHPEMIQFDKHIFQMG